MKRKVVAIITLSFLLQIVAQYGFGFQINSVFADATEKRPEGILFETKNYIKTDLSTNVPEKMKDNLVADKGNLCYTIDGKNKVVRNEGVGRTQLNSYAEFDFKLVTSTGSTSGAFSFAPCAPTGNNQVGIRFAYVSAIKYNPETKLGNGTEVIYDRIAIVRAASDSANSWLYAAISDKELGVQSSERSTSWLRMKGVCLDGMYYLSIYTAEGELLDSISVSAEEIMGENVDGLNKNGCFMVTSNSCEVLLDNIVCSGVDNVSEPTLSFETKTAAINEPVGYGLYADGKNIAIENVQIKTNDEDAIIDEDNSKVTYPGIGQKELIASIYDINTKEYKNYETTIEVKEKLDIVNLRVEAEDKIYLNESIPIKVVGIDVNGDEFDITHYNFTVDKNAIFDSENKTIRFNTPGINRLVVSFDGMQVYKDIYVSKYEGLLPVITEQKLENGSSTNYVLNAIIGGVQKPVYDYTVVADKEGIVLDNGTLTTQKRGEYTVTFTCDNISESVIVDVVEKAEGIMIEEFFEGSAPSSEYFQWDDNQIVEDGGNHVLLLEDEESRFYGSSEWKRYKIEARVKIETPVLDSRCEYSTFEITPQRQDASSQDYEKGGGKGGITCIYRINHNIDGGSHMRIGPAMGERINIEDGKYHDFVIEVYGTQVKYTIDDVTQYYNLMTNSMGYFTITANNCRVYIDNLKVIKEKPTESDNVTKLEAEQPVVEVNPYEPWQFRAINAFKAFTDDGSFYYATNHNTSYSYNTDNENVTEFEQIDGFDYADVLRKNTILFDKNAPDGAEVTVKAKYKNKECTFIVKAKRPVQDYKEYVKQSVDIHRENYIFRLCYGFNKGLSPSITNASTLPHRIMVMAVYPKIHDYTNVVKWYATSAEYQDKVIGRGSDAGDFIILQGMVMYNKLYGIANVSDEAWNAWKNYMINFEWSYPNVPLSENHKMIYFATAVLAGEAWPDAIMYNGKTGEETAFEQKQYLMDWYNHRLKYGIGEYDSPNYYNVDLFGSELLYTSVEDADVKEAAYNFMNFIYADITSDAFEDNISGAKSRDYHSLNYTSKIKPYGFCFNTSTYMTDENYQFNVQEGQYAFTQYMPADILFDIALDEDRFFVNKERHFVYTLLDDPAVTESIRKYTYITPDYSVGSCVYVDDLSHYIVDDAYNLKADTGTWDRLTPIYANYQEIAWTMNLGKGGESVITENHPGSTGGHSDFYGDALCFCSKYFQEKGASIGMHKIDRSTEYKRTHFWLPKDMFEKVEEINGWIFIKHFDTYAAIKPLKDGEIDGTLYEWGASDLTYGGLKRSESEVITYSANTAFVSEITSKDEFGADYDAFKNKVMANEHNIAYCVSDTEYSLEYTSISGDKLKIDYLNNERYLNDVKVDFNEYKLFDNKYVQSDWNAGAVSISYGDESMEIGEYKTSLNVQETIKLIKQIDGLRKNLEYEEKFGRANLLLNSNMSDIVYHFEKTLSYKKSYLRDIVTQRLGLLLETVNQNYEKADTKTKGSLELSVSYINQAFVQLSN